MENNTEGEVTASAITVPAAGAPLYESPPQVVACALADAQGNTTQRPAWGPHNGTVFGRILRGELPATILYEDEQVLCFRDISPASTHHYLVIPKEHIRHVGTLTSAHLPLLQHMMAVAAQVAKANGVNDVPAARHRGELLLGFHRFPLITVYHLHLHLIFPAPVQSWWKRLLFPNKYGRFFISPELVAEWASVAPPRSNLGNNGRTAMD